jgi:hypothetical protein
MGARARARAARFSSRHRTRDAAALSRQAGAQELSSRAVAPSVRAVRVLRDALECRAEGVRQLVAAQRRATQVQPLRARARARVALTRSTAGKAVSQAARVAGRPVAPREPLAQGVVVGRAARRASRARAPPVRVATAAIRGPLRTSAVTPRGTGNDAIKTATWTPSIGRPSATGHRPLNARAGGRALAFVPKNAPATRAACSRRRLGIQLQSARPARARRESAVTGATRGRARISVVRSSDSTARSPIGSSSASSICSVMARDRISARERRASQTAMVKPVLVAALTTVSQPPVCPDGHGRSERTHPRLSSLRPGSALIPYSPYIAM